MRGSNCEIQRMRHAPCKARQQNVGRAPAIVGGMIHVRDKEVRRFHFRGDPGTVTKMSKEVPECVMSAGTVTTTITEQRMVSFHV